MKSHFAAIREIEVGFQPKEKGFISNEEIEFVKKAMELEGRSKQDLNDLLDFFCFYFEVKKEEIANKAEKAETDAEWKKLMDERDAISDKVSAVCGVFDEIRKEM